MFHRVLMAQFAISCSLMKQTFVIGVQVVFRPMDLKNGLKKLPETYRTTVVSCSLPALLL
ncbi:hypothetical protein SDC9_60308 [bioreactor metagenome]|uniref:Uncharacterized protein n=1 Tax=bioreactor metagenome TaxID=1076179 RepID=A0A644XDV7_9ZZZZ